MHMTTLPDMSVFRAPKSVIATTERMFLTEYITILEV